MNRHDLAGRVFARLTVVKDSGTRSPSGDIRWECLCSCGNTTTATANNLKAGHVRSCGCLRTELLVSNGKARKQPTKKCNVPDCEHTIEKGGSGMCGKHYARLKRHGDANNLTPEPVKR